MLRNINKKNLVSLIKYLGITFDEVVVEIVIDEVIFDSIE